MYRKFILEIGFLVGKTIYLIVFQNIKLAIIDHMKDVPSRLLNKLFSMFLFARKYFNYVQHFNSLKVIL